MQVRLPEPRRAKTKKVKQKEEENAHQAAVEAARLAVLEGSYIVIYNISTGSLPSEVRRLDLRTDFPLTMFGGPLLGVVTNKIRGMISHT